MSLARWEAITRIFEAALDQPSSGRAEFVRKTCEDDKELESEVLRLLAADERAGSFLESPVLSTIPRAWSTNLPSLLQPGSVISGRFEILRFLGQGGMGQVYEAFDLELKGRIALKAIRPEISSDQRVLSRFRREVQLTRRITHPNVCRTFDIDRQVSDPGTAVESDITFLTMELLEGETLADLLRREGGLRTEEALPLVRQMIEALNAAHQVGIVHRDFKPSNVLLVPSNGGCRLVVTDFGLARAILPDGQASAEQLANSLTDSHALLGTLVYMAPEQLERGEATVASDIYSLGLVMYEMVTGQRPFADPIPFAEAVKRIKQAAPSPKLLVPDLDPTSEAVIRRCLEIEPKDRFESVRQVLEEIESVKQDVPAARSLSTQVILKRSQGPFGDQSRKGSWRKWIAAIAACVVVSLFAVFLRHYQWRATVPDGASVLLTEVANQTPDQELNATTDLLLHELNQSAHFNVIERSKIRAVLQQMARPYQQQLDPTMAREVAWRAGGTLVIYGTVSRLGPALSLDLRLERLGKQPKDSPRSWYKSFQANDKSDLFNAIQAGSQWIREMAGEGSDSFAKEKLPQDTTTSSWEALLLYSQAEQLKALDQTPEAIDRLIQAIRVDPEFALAWMRLGDLSNSIERDGDAFRFWEKALDAARKHPLTKKEEMRIKGLYASDTGDYETAEHIFQEWEVLYPKDYLPSFYLAGALRGTGRYEEAIEKLNEAERKQPNAWYIVAQRSHYHLATGRYDQLVPDLKRLRELGQSETVDQIQGALDFVHGDYDGAIRHFNALSNSPDDYWKSLSYSIVASFLSEMGRYSEAKALLLKGVEFDTARGRIGALADKEIELAYLSFRTQDRDGCKKSALTAVDKEDGPTHLKIAGSMLVRCGFPDLAERLEQRLRPLLNGPVFQIARHRIAGEVFLAKKDTLRAIAEFRAEANLESSESPKEYLARALSSAGQHDEALTLYRKIVVSPGQIWQESDVEFPGLWADALFQEGRLDSALHRSGAGLRKYVHVRQHSDPTFEEPKIARELLQALDGPQVLQSIQQ